MTTERQCPYAKRYQGTCKNRRLKRLTLSHMEQDMFAVPFLKKPDHRAGEMAWQIRVLTSLDTCPGSLEPAMEGDNCFPQLVF